MHSGMGRFNALTTVREHCVCIDCSSRELLPDNQYNIHACMMLLKTGIAPKVKVEINSFP